MARPNYPAHVLGELATMRLVAQGRSISRYGDGEFKMCCGAGIKSQMASGTLSARLRGILRDSGQCLVGIPNIFSPTPKIDFWRPKQNHANLLVDRPYVSSFITRPDSAPWIDTAEYWALWESLWKDQHVTLVRGSGKSFTAERLMLAGAAKVTEILPQVSSFNGKQQHAWEQYQELLERIGTPTRAILCLGPTATVMAVDLCAKGVHAIDAGHMGMFYNKRAQGLPMCVLPEDRMLPA